MSDKILEVINPDGDLKEQLEMIRANFLALQKTSLGQAAQVLFSGKLSADVTLTSSYQTIGDLSSAFTSSGGLVLICGQASVNAASATASVRIMIDDEEKTLSAFGTSGVTVPATIPVFWAEKMAEGSHKLQFQAKASSGTLYESTAGNSTLWVIEFLV